MPADAAKYGFRAPAEPFPDLGRGQLDEKSVVEAGQLGLLGLPVFVFQEGNDRAASRLFPQIAKLTRGAYCKFDRNSPDQLKRLLGAVAAYAAGGRAALLKYGKEQGGAAALLTNQMK